MNWIWRSACYTQNENNRQIRGWRPNTAGTLISLGKSPPCSHRYRLLLALPSPKCSVLPLPTSPSNSPTATKMPRSRMQSPLSSSQELSRVQNMPRSPRVLLSLPLLSTANSPMYPLSTFARISIHRHHRMSRRVANKTCF